MYIVVTKPESLFKDFLKLNWDYFSNQPSCSLSENIQ